LVVPFRLLQKMENWFGKPIMIFMGLCIKNKPKSLNHDSKANPANRQKNIATARGKGYYSKYASKKVMHGVRDFAILTGITWVADVVSVSLQRHADNNIDEEGMARAMINVQAQNF
jgi:hypothetical protein